MYKKHVKVIALEEHMHHFTSFYFGQSVYNLFSGIIKLKKKTVYMSLHWLAPNIQKCHDFSWI